MTVKRVIALFYGFQFFFSLLLWVPIFYEYQKRMGLDDAQIFSIQSVYYLAFCLFEIPTGYLADRWSHRQCMRLGGLVLAGANLLPVFAPSYLGFLAHFLLVALARSLISGASSAYLYDYLREHGEGARYKQAEGRARAYGLIGKIGGWAVIGYLMEWKLSLPYTLTAVAGLVSAGFASLLPEFSVRIADREGARPRAGVGEVGRRLARSPVLLLIMLQGVALFVLTRICQVNLFQPILHQRGFGVSSYGLIMAGTSVFEALGAAYPGLLRKWAGDLQGVFVLTAILALSLSWIAVSGPFTVLVALSLFAWVAGISFPVQRQVVNDAIPDARYRATFLSVESILDRAANAWVAAVLAGFVATGRTDEFLLVSAAVSGGVVLVLLFAFRSKRAALALKNLR